MPAIPERIGKYQISEVLGQGAMGVVYKGFDPHIHRPVAIKTVHKALLGDGDTAQDSIAARFRNEAQAVGRIAHPGVVAIYEFGEDETTAYIAMEFVQGRNLDQVLAGTPLLEEAQVQRIMDQLLGALAAAHAQGVWHRDIKPANLLLTADGQVKLTDFGIARIQHAGLTQVSSMIGTPGYMAPEQYMGEGVDHRADLFACGVLLWRLLAGKAPFTGPAEVVMYKVLNEQPPAPSTLAERPAAYDAVVARAMAKRPEDRFASAAELRQALADIAAGRAGAAAAGDGDATVIVPPAYWQRAVEAAAVPAPAPSGVAAGSSALAVPGWDPVLLTRVERALASQIGPMAKLMVRRAAADCTDLPSLATRLATHVPEGPRRQQFISTATGGSVAQPATAAPGTAFAPPPGSGAVPAPVPSQVVQLSEDFKTRAGHSLTRYLGPVARIVAKRAAEQCGGDAQRFVHLLLEAVPEKDRAKLRQDLGSPIG